MSHEPIYLDHHATTPVDPRVLDAMLPYFTERFGNSASKTHVYGWVAEEAVELARRQLAVLIGAPAGEIVFTSGATESNNLAIKGVAEACAAKGKHIVTSVAEHPCVLDTCVHLQKQGWEVTYLPVDGRGFVNPDDVARAIRSDTALVSIMLANNEVGTIQDIRAIGEVARARGVPMHSDIAQAVGKIPVRVDELNIDLASVSGHKFYGPKGVGALFVRKRKPRVHIVAQMDGGGHENGLRSGTLNVPAIVGLGKAAELCQREMETDNDHNRRLRDRLYHILSENLSDLRLNGPDIESADRLPNNLNVSFGGVDAEGLIVALKRIAVSSGSACTSALPKPSHVLQAMGVTPEWIRSSLRFGVGRSNTMEEINLAGERVVEVVKKLRMDGIVSKENS